MVNTRFPLIPPSLSVMGDLIFTLAFCAPTSSPVCEDDFFPLTVKVGTLEEVLYLVFVCLFSP